MKPYFSVLMPVHNSQSTLEDAINSVRQNDCDDWELLIVDDGSTDNSVHLALKAAFHDMRIKVLTLEHQGLVPTLNQGLQECQGSWIARFDSDDLMSPHRLSSQKKLIESNLNLKIVGGGVKFFPEENVGGGLKHYEEWINSLKTPNQLQCDIFVEAPISHSAATFHKETILALGAYREGSFPEDYDLYFRLWQAGHSFAAVDDVVLHWRQHDKRLSFNDSRYSPEAFFNLKSNYLLRNRLKKDKNQDIVIFGTGEEGKKWSEHLRHKGFHLKAWVDVDPRKQGKKIHDAPVFSYEDFAILDEKAAHFLLTVGINSARHEIREYLDRLGYKEEKDYTCLS